MGRRSKMPELSESETLPRAEIEAQITRLRELVVLRSGGAARHQTVRTLARWEGVLEQRFGIAAPKRPNRS